MEDYLFHGIEKRFAALFLHHKSPQCNTIKFLPSNLVINQNSASKKIHIRALEALTYTEKCKHRMEWLLLLN